VRPEIPAGLLLEQLLAQPELELAIIGVSSSGRDLPLFLWDSAQEDDIVVVLQRGPLWKRSFLLFFFLLYLGGGLRDGVPTSGTNWPTAEEGRNLLFRDGNRGEGEGQTPANLASTTAVVELPLEQGVAGAKALASKSPQGSDP
jgi:hypothetical protein